MAGENEKTEQAEATKPRSHGATKGGLREALGIPPGCVLIKRARGPQQAQNGLIGMVHLGGVYTVDTSTAVVLTADGGEFDPLPEFADEVEAQRAKEPASK